MAVLGFCFEGVGGWGKSNVVSILTSTLLSKTDEMNATCENMNPKAEVYSNCASKICSNSDEDSEGDSTDDQSMLNYIISSFCFNLLFNILLVITVWMRMKMSMKKSNSLFACAVMCLLKCSHTAKDVGS